MATVEAPAVFPEVVVDRKFLFNRQGKDYILYTGLVDALHQLSGGYFAIDTRLEQLPSAENGSTAVCSAVVRVFDAADPDVVRRVASGIGDASPGNVSSMMAGALIRMAETRAKARALRDLCNIAMVAVEELGDDTREAPPPAAVEKTRPAPTSSTPTPAAEHILIEGKAYGRPEVWAAYTRRKAQLEALGMPILPGDVLAEDAPLSLLVAATQGFRRRLLAREGE